MEGVTITLNVTGTCERTLDLFAVERVKAMGLLVMKSMKWETPRQFEKRLGICSQTRVRKMHNPACPHVDMERADNGKGRLVALASNPQFEDFMRAHIPCQVAGRKNKKKGRPA